jgi:hypothetical protein
MGEGGPSRFGLWDGSSMKLLGGVGLELFLRCRGPRPSTPPRKDACRGPRPSLRMATSERGILSGYGDLLYKAPVL